MYFRFSTAKSGNDDEGTFFFLVDSVRVARVKELVANSSHGPQGSATINLHLTAGQEVQVMNAVSRTVHGTDTTGFLYS